MTMEGNGTIEGNGAAPDGQPTVLVLGIGNLLWADEAFGVRVLEQLHARYRFPDHVTIMDGGTQGLYLVQYVQEADRLIVFDALDYGMEPGTLKLVRDDEVPRFSGVKKMSLHQTGFQEVLNAADLLDGLPQEMLLIGVQAEDLEDWCGPMTGKVASQIDAAMAACLEQMAAWGIAAEQRPADEQARLLEHGLDRAAFEGGPRGL